MKIPEKITVDVGSDVPTIKKGYFNDGDYLNYSYGEYIDLQYMSLEESIVKLQDLQEKYSDMYDNLRFQTSQNCGCYNECDCTPTIKLVGDRLPYDIEVQFFSKQNEKKEQQQLARERAEYEKLRVKFEGE